MSTKQANGWKLEDATFVVLVVVITLAFAWLMTPYFGAILWGLVTAIVFGPVYRWITVKLGGRKGVAAGLTLLLILALVILPAILLEAPYLMSARVLEKSRIAMVPAGPLRRAFDHEPLLMRAAAFDLARYWRILVQQIKDLKLRSAHERVAAHFSSMCHETRSGPATLILDEEFRSIAAKLGMTPESWSRSIRQLEPVGVRAVGRRIEIDNIHRLREFAGIDGLR